MSSLEGVLNARPVSPAWEMGAYEALWARKNTTFKTIADAFKKSPDAIPSEFVSEAEIEQAMVIVRDALARRKINDFGVRLHGTEDYPERLRDATHPVELLYYRGSWDLVDAPKRIAVVGSRNVSEEGVRRTRKLVSLLVEEGYTIISGLARGVDTVAHKTAIECGGNTIAVIGTPITEHYPPENKSLQDLIAERHLLISQVPIGRYSAQTPHSNRLFFPERNATMSALAQATIIVEASNTSGTLVQARASLNQGRKLLILDNCFKNPELSWPLRFEARGALRVTSIEDIRAALE